MIGICGVAMGTLAGMLKAKGYTVAGSDANVYPPMSDKLKEWGIDIYNGFNLSHIGRPDLVIIGNVISRGNVEAEAVLDRKIPYLSMAQALYEFFLKGKEIVSISGTHGKTTTTALLSHILEVAGEKPSFFIGGVSNNYQTNFKLGQGKYFVIEGDEYDSAFFEKIPKFVLYRPHHTILTSLEFDHADIYDSLDEIKLWFKRLVNIISSKGNILFINDNSHLRAVTEKAFSACYSYGGSGADFHYKVMGYSDSFTDLEIRSEKFERISLQTSLFGVFNFENITAAAAMSLLLGIDKAFIQKAVASFTGVKRRQELLYDKGHLKIYDDFAHHPTSIKFVLEGMKKRFPQAALWAFYEPRSSTSRRSIFQDELPGSFVDADKIFIKQPYKLAAIPEHDRIDIDRVVHALAQQGKEVHLFDSVEEIVNDAFLKLKPDEPAIITIMSNGGFDGIAGRMVEKAKATFQDNGQERYAEKG